MLVFARVDSHWAKDVERGENVDPQGIGPQSHVVNARTDETWEKENGGRRVRGRVWWSSSAFAIREGGSGDVGGLGVIPEVEGEDYIEGGGGEQL